MDDELLSPEERDAIAALPKEGRTSRLLEERVVRSLRAEGILRRAHRERILLTPTRAALAATAFLLVAALSFFAGHWSGSRQAIEVARLFRDENGRAAAARVQETGSAYVRAMAMLAEAGRGDPDASRQGREAAVAALYAALQQVAVLAGDEAVSGATAASLSGDEWAGEENADSTGRRILWF